MAGSNKVSMTILLMVSRMLLYCLSKTPLRSGGEKRRGEERMGDFVQMSCCSVVTSTAFLFMNVYTDTS